MSRPEDQRRKPEAPLLHPMDWAADAGAAAEILKVMDRRLAVRRRRRSWAAASSGAALVIALATWIVRDGELETSPATIPSSVLVNAPERDVLRDGSVVERRTGAVVRVVFTEAIRRVVLEQGAAHFEVAKDPARPFVVEVRGIEVRAVGTAFAVFADGESTEVLVTEGRVAVDRADDGAIGDPEALPNSRGKTGVLAVTENVARPEPLAILGAGGRAIVETATPVNSVRAQVDAVSSSEMAERLAWRVPILEFSGTPLTEAIPMLNRYAQIQLVLAHPKLGKVRLSGMLRADSQETLLRLLEEEHGIVARPGGENQLVLVKAH
jgi:transmembrane sensor